MFKKDIKNMRVERRMSLDPFPTLFTVYTMCRRHSPAENIRQICLCYIGKEELMFLGRYAEVLLCTVMYYDESC